MKLRRFALTIGFLLTNISLPLYAANLQQTDLMQAYYQALKSDPTFKRATADWESAKQNLPIARAGYLTQVALTANLQRQYNKTAPFFDTPDEIAQFNSLQGGSVTTGFIAGSGYNYDYGFILSVEQPVFNLPAWDAIRSARASVKAATAMYSAASQDLMVRTVRAYVGVLQAYDQLRFQLARKRAVYEQLKVAQQRFKVGLIGVTGVYDARAVYDQSVARSIADQNWLNDTVEVLAEVTGTHYRQLRGIEKQIPLVVPKPNDINAWAEVAMQQNYSLIAQNYTVLASRETLKQQSTRWAPQLNIAAQYLSDRQTELHDGPFIIPNISTHNVLYGFTLDFPVIQGGLVTANTRQAKYNYLSASSQREFIYRSIVSNTRQSFLGVITGISEAQANWRSVISAQNALNATKAGYEVGTRTMSDILDDVTILYQEEQKYMDAQYQYIIDVIELKFNAGTLNVQDIKTINGWLKKDIKLNLSEAALKTLQSYLKPIRSFPNVPNASNKTPTMQKLAKNKTSKQKVVSLTQKKSIKTKRSHMKSSLKHTVNLPMPLQNTSTSATSKKAFEKAESKQAASNATFDIPAPKATQSFYSKKGISPACGGVRAPGFPKGRAQAPLGSPSARVSRAGEILSVKKLGRLRPSFLSQALNPPVITIDQSN